MLVLRMQENTKRRSTAEIAIEMNATAVNIAGSVPSPKRAVALLKELRRTNDDLREKLGRARHHAVDGGTPRVDAILPPEPAYAEPAHGAASLPRLPSI